MQLLTLQITDPSSACSCHGSTLASACSPERRGRCRRLKGRCGSPPSVVPAAPAPVHSSPLWREQKPISDMKPSHTEIISSSKRHLKTSSLFIWDFLLPSAASFNYCMGKDCLNILLNFSFCVPQNKESHMGLERKEMWTVIIGQFLVFDVNEHEGQNCCSGWQLFRQKKKKINLYKSFPMEKILRKTKIMRDLITN